jgi:geranylgeranyl pyrophosphate synthase
VSNTAQAQLGAVLAAGGSELAELLERTEARLAEVADGHGEALGRHAGGTLAAGGKRLRPVLVFLCAGEEHRGAAGTARGFAHGDERLVAAGSAVELLHMATLVHDDVLDGAELRRGRPTVFAEGGRGAATATGDLLFSRAFAELAATGSEDAVRALSAASSALARGELMQRADAWSEDVTPERYLERCRLKTASLFEASCRLGALFGGRPELAEALGRFGERLGVAFQMLDDVLDVAGPPERTGKPRGADLLDGTVTLPLILARRRDPSLSGTVRCAEEASAVCDRIAATGALEEAREQALGYVSEAKRALAGLELSEQRTHALDLVADGVVERYA